MKMVIKFLQVLKKCWSLISKAILKFFVVKVNEEEKKKCREIFCAPSR